MDFHIRVHCLVYQVTTHSLFLLYVWRGANFIILYICCATWKQQRLLKGCFVHSSFSSIIAASFCSNVKESSLIGKLIATLCYDLVVRGIKPWLLANKNVQISLCSNKVSMTLTSLRKGNLDLKYVAIRNCPNILYDLCWSSLIPSLLPPREASVVDD